MIVLGRTLHTTYDREGGEFILLKGRSTIKSLKPLVVTYDRGSLSCKKLKIQVIATPHISCTIIIILSGKSGLVVRKILILYNLCFWDFTK